MLILLADAVYTLGIHPILVRRLEPPLRERVTLGERNDGVEREHVARYNFARALCVNKTVADIACGTGYGVRTLREVAARVDGYDKEDFGDNFQIDLEKQSWDRQYDVIVSFETIEHLANPELFLENVRRTAKLLVLSAPLNERKGMNPFHKQVWTFPEIKALLEKSFRCDYLFQNAERIVSDVPTKRFLVAVCQPSDRSPAAVPP